MKKGRLEYLVLCIGDVHGQLDIGGKNSPSKFWATARETWGSCSLCYERRSRRADDTVEPRLSESIGIAFSSDKASRGLDNGEFG